MLFACLILLILAVLLLFAVLFLLYRTGAEQRTALSGELYQLTRQSAADTRQAMNESMGAMGKSLNTGVHAMGQSVAASVRDMSQGLELRMANLETSNDRKLEALRGSMNSAMASLRQENSQKLDEIRGVVDEKLQETLQKQITESFRSVSAQLEQVYKGLGEMQHLASDVGGLKKVLSGVKTRGILGELQLGAILEEILAPEQYATNVATIPGSRERVEFALKLPGGDTGSVYLPIDSKFPGDVYARLRDAQISGDPAALENARRELAAFLRRSARDIRDKYVSPPHTTTFGILFLPFEGLYAEAAEQGMIEILQREFSINIAGPSTMAALLNALQMGFRTLAIQQRSSEVWQVLGSVKTEFDKFEDVMTRMQGHLQQTSNDLESLLGARTRAINRQLRQIQQLEE